MLQMGVTRAEAALGNGHCQKCSQGEVMSGIRIVGSRACTGFFRGGGELVI
jgi:hypothetical protein